MGLVSPTRSAHSKRPPSPKYDRALALVIWAITGLLVGLALGIFIGGQGLLWLAVGLVLGLLAGVFRTRRQPQIEED
jgi:F0F1-type ATP synthase assembly protein I